MKQEHQDLLEYFERMAAELPFRAEYRHGAELTQEWFEMMARSLPSQAEFDEFFSRIENIDRCGSRIFDLWLRVRHWGYHQGLVVPLENPWKDDLSKITCIVDGEFGGQITEGREYIILAKRESEKLVRIANDQKKHRWYPFKYFRFPKREIRQFIYKMEDGSEGRCTNDGYPVPDRLTLYDMSDKTT